MEGATGRYLLLADSDYFFSSYVSFLTLALHSKIANGA